MLRLPETGLRRDLWVSIADAAAFSVMVGCGETYLPAFALAVGHGPVAAGLVASVPVLVGAVVQLVTPLAVERLGTNRGWVIACCAVQSLSFVPLVLWAFRGTASLVELLLAASVYWSAGMAGAPAWSAWMGTLVPARVRTPYFAQRNRLGQFGVLIGFVLGGIVLQYGASRGAASLAFAVVFALAGFSRLVSTAFLVACSEPVGTVGPPSHLPPASIIRRVRTALARMASAPSGALVVFLWCFVFGAQFSAPYFTPYMLREMGFSYGAFMVVMATSFLAKAVMLPWLGRLGSRVGSVRLLWLGSLSIVPLSILWLVSANVGYLVGVQVIAGTCWACYELAVALLFFDAVRGPERTGVVTVYNLGLAIATVAGAGAGGLVLRMLGEDRSAYFAVFAISSLLRLITIPLLRRVRLSASAAHDDQPEGSVAS